MFISVCKYVKDNSVERYSFHILFNSAYEGAQLVCTGGGLKVHHIHICNSEYSLVFFKIHIHIRTFHAIFFF